MSTKFAMCPRGCDLRGPKRIAKRGPRAGWHRGVTDDDHHLAQDRGPLHPGPRGPVAGTPLARAARDGTGDAHDGAPPARSARRHRARPRPDAPVAGDRLPTRRLGDPHLREATLLRLGRLVGRAPHGGAPTLARADAARAREPALAGLRQGTRDGDRRDARGPARSRSGLEPGLHDEREDPRRQLSRSQGQRGRAVLPLAHGRGDGDAPRTVRAGLRGDRRRRARAPDPRELRRRGGRSPVAQDGRGAGAHEVRRAQVRAPARHLAGGVQGLARSSGSRMAT